MNFTPLPSQGRGWGLGLYFTQLRTAIERSHAIAKFQGNDNSFVLDITLAERAYCNF
ncbi:MAG: hypothetical protein V7K68_06450 [Nostoc sp.]|uniref:hypothetical protein n=1 Tax=Nostoc sp. TaxID=1180 RepID=UPI002FF62DE2